MASQRVRTQVLQHFFETSTYGMYAFALEKSRRLVGWIMCLAIFRNFAKPAKLTPDLKYFSLLFLLLLWLGDTSLSWAEKTEIAPMRPIQNLEFCGGPDGGTFQYFANGIASRLSQLDNQLLIRSIPTAGSVENLRRINRGENQFGIVYAGDLLLGWKGELTGDPHSYRTPRTLAYLYGAPAHLMVTQESNIHSIYELTGKRIAVGGVGSGAAAAAQRFLTAIGLWEKTRIKFIGYNQAADQLATGEVEAVWVLAGHPNAAVTMAAARQPIRLLDTWQAASEAGLIKRFPFYSRTIIPAGTYQGVDTDIQTFEDSAFWVANPQVSEIAVRGSLEGIFSNAGLNYMGKVKSTARQMSRARALRNMVVPLHRGAETYWASQGIALPSPLIESLPGTKPAGH